MSRKRSSSRKAKRQRGGKSKRGGGIMSGMRSSLRTAAGTSNKTSSKRSKLIMNGFTVAAVLLAAYLLARRLGWL